MLWKASYTIVERIAITNWNVWNDKTIHVRPIKAFRFFLSVSLISNNCFLAMEKCVFFVFCCWTRRFHPFNESESSSHSLITKCWWCFIRNEYNALVGSSFSSNELFMSGVSHHSVLHFRNERHQERKIREKKNADNENRVENMMTACELSTNKPTTMLIKTVFSLPLFFSFFFFSNVRTSNIVIPVMDIACFMP